jgi:hypothetical protein
MSNESERIWKEAFVALSMRYPGIGLEELDSGYHEGGSINKVTSPLIA